MRPSPASFGVLERVVSASIIHAIMDLAIEDATPLFDLTCAVKGTDSALTQDEAIVLARRCVRVLVQNQYLEVLRDCHAVSTPSHRHVVPLTEDEGMRAIEDDALWVYHPLRGAAGEWIAVGATSRGEMAHRNGRLIWNM